MKERLPSTNLDSWYSFPIILLESICFSPFRPLIVPPWHFRAGYYSPLTSSRKNRRDVSSIIFYDIGRPQNSPVGLTARRIRQLFPHIPQQITSFNSACLSLQFGI